MSKQLFDLADSLGTSRQLMPILEALDKNQLELATALINTARSDLDILTNFTVQKLRIKDRTWAQIGHLFNISGQAAHKRFRHLFR